MPTYPLVCASCDHAFEHTQSIRDPILRTCPECGVDALAQDYAAKNVIVNDGVARTVGQQAEQNAKKMGKELHALEAERMLGPKALAKKKAKTPWYRKDGSKPLDLSTVKDTTKFIMTGDKS